MNLLSLADWPRDQIESVIQLSIDVKEHPQLYARARENRVLLMMFEKPSLRTRVSFEAAMLRLGGHAIHYDLAMSPWARGKETPADTARSASRYVDAIMARLFRRADLHEIAGASRVPVINGLTDLEHPCQALGDLMTLRERFGRLEGLKLAYVGDANNNVTHSLLDGCAKMGVHLSIGCPRGKEFSPLPEVLARARREARRSGSRIEVVHRAEDAVRGAHAIYTDTWMSYHIPRERASSRRKALKSFQVTVTLMDRADGDAVFMHCLPALRGQEQTAEVMDGPRSIVFDQAENRLHSEKAILLTVMP